MIKSTEHVPVGRALLHWVFFAPRNGLPVRYWRLIWLTGPIRLLVLPLALVLFVPHAIAQGIVWATDQLGGLFGSLYVRCYNRDLERSGWTSVRARVPAPELSPEWIRRGDEAR